MDAAVIRRLVAGALVLALASPAQAAPDIVPAPPPDAADAPVDVSDVSENAEAARHDVPDDVPVPAPVPVSTEAVTDAAVSSPDPATPSSERAKWLAAGGLALTYAAFSTYAYFAWFRGRQNGGEGFTFDGFGLYTYAGGADKLGHAWTAYALTRGTTAMLTHAGWSRLGSSIVAASVSQIFFTLSEYEDSLVYQFEVYDIVANVAGAAFAVAMINLPSLDRWIDFRLEYLPSKDYRRTLREERNIDFFQDYSGQSYMLALHLDALPRMPRALRFVDVVAGFETRNYSPPRADESQAKTQRLYLGVALNVQHLLGELFADSRGRRVARSVFEHVSVPFTTWKALDASRSQ